MKVIIIRIGHILLMKYLILDICDIRSRVIILLMTSTGMRIGALPDLRLSDIKKMDEFGLYLVYVYSQSKKDRYYTFTTPECAKAMITLTSEKGAVKN